MAFKTATHVLIWAPEQAHASVKHINSINGCGSPNTAGLAVDGLSNVSLVASDQTDGTNAKDSVSGNRNRHDFIGTLSKEGSSGSLTIQCFAWFEGTDPSIINDNLDKLNKVSVDLSFYARSIYVAP